MLSKEQAAKLYNYLTSRPRGASAYRQEDACPCTPLEIGRALEDPAFARTMTDQIKRASEAGNMSQALDLANQAIGPGVISDVVAPPGLPEDAYAVFIHLCQLRALAGEVRQPPIRR